MNNVETNVGINTGENKIDIFSPSLTLYSEIESTRMEIDTNVETK